MKEVNPRPYVPLPHPPHHHLTGTLGSSEPASDWIPRPHHISHLHINTSTSGYQAPERPGLLEFSPNIYVCLMPFMIALFWARLLLLGDTFSFFSFRAVFP